MNVDEIKRKRKHVLKSGVSKVLIRKGDQRIQYPKLCAVCSRKLATTDIIEDEVGGKLVHVHRTEAKANYISVTINDIIKVSLCADIRQCYNEIQRKEKQDGLF